MTEYVEANVINFDLKKHLCSEIQRGEVFLNELEEEREQATKANDFAKSLQIIFNASGTRTYIQIFKLALKQLEEQDFKSQLEKDGRVYVIISAKHMANDRGRLIFWGSDGATKTDSKRSFGGYTCDFSKCERYTREEIEKGNRNYIREHAEGRINWKKMFKSVSDFYIRVDRIEELTGYRFSTSFYQRVPLA